MASLNRSKSILGVDISSEFVRMVQVSLDKKPVVECVGVAPIPSGVFGDGEQFDFLGLKDCVEQLYLTRGFTAKIAHVSVPNRFVSVRQMSLPALPESDIRGVIEFELTNIVHLPFHDPVFDFVHVPASSNPEAGVSATFDPTSPADAWTNRGNVTDLNGDRQRDTGKDKRFGLSRILGNKTKDVKPAGNVMVIAAPKALVNGVDAMMQSLGCRVDRVEISAVAIERALRELGGLLHSCVIVEVTRTVVNIHVFFQNVLRLSRNMPIDAALLREAPQQNSNFAEDTLRETAASFGMQTPGLSDEASVGNGFPLDFHIRGELPLARELASELDRTMNFVRYTLNQRSAVFHEIALVTTLPDAKSLADSIHDRLDVPVRAVSWHDLDVSIEAHEAHEASRRADDTYDSDFTGAIGLVLKERQA